MKKIKFKKHRIVKDNFNGYECQVWRLWFPFWVEMNFSNTHTSIEKAKSFIENNNNTVVWKS